MPSTGRRTVADDESMETDPRGLAHSRHQNNASPPQGRPDDDARARRDRETAEMIRQHKDDIRSILGKLRELRGGLDKEKERNAETMVSMALALIMESNALNDALIKESEAENNNSKIIVWINWKDLNKVIIKNTAREEQPK